MDTPGTKPEPYETYTRRVRDQLVEDLRAENTTLKKGRLRRRILLLPSIVLYVAIGIGIWEFGGLEKNYEEPLRSFVDPFFADESMMVNTAVVELEIDSVPSTPEPQLIASATEGAVKAARADGPVRTKVFKTPGSDCRESGKINNCRSLPFARESIGDIGAWIVDNDDKNRSIPATLVWTDEINVEHMVTVMVELDDSKLVYFTAQLPVGDPWPRKSLNAYLEKAEPSVAGL